MGSRKRTEDGASVSVAPYRVKDATFYTSSFARRLRGALAPADFAAALVLCDWCILRGGRLGATSSPGLGDLGMMLRVDPMALVSKVAGVGLLRFDDASGWLWMPNGVVWQNRWIDVGNKPVWSDSKGPNAIKGGASQWQSLWRDIDALLETDFPWKAGFASVNREPLHLDIAAERLPSIRRALDAASNAASDGSVECAHPMQHSMPQEPRHPTSRSLKAASSATSNGPSNAASDDDATLHRMGASNAPPGYRIQDAGRSEGPAREPAPTRESTEGTMTISRSQLEAEIAESQAVRDPEPERTPLVAAGPLHPRTSAKTVDELLEGIEFPGAFDNVGDPMPELPSMKSVDRRPLAERLPEMFGGLKLDVPPARLAEAEAYDASRKASAEAKAAVMDPEDAAFEEALATWVDLYSLDERAHKLIKRSVSEIPQGLEAHHEACRQACATLGSKYAKAVSVPLGMPAKVAIMRAVLLLVEDGRVSVPGAVERLNTMLDWWTATDGNPKRRGDDGKDWFADAIAVFGGKETLQAASGNPRDAGSVLMGHLNASAAWKHARERKLDASKDPFAATGTETYYGIGEALKRGDWGVKQ